MATTTFSGPLRVGSAAANTAWPVIAAASIALTPTAAASTEFTVVVPKCRILRVTTGTDTAFTGATVTAQVGTTLGGAQIVAAVDVKPAATVNHTLVAATLDDTLAEGTTLYVRLAQTTPTAVGDAVMTIEFVPLA